MLVGLHMLFVRDIVFATARGPVAPGSMEQGLLCRFHIDIVTRPNLQSRLLDCAAKRKRQCPRQSRLEPDIHGIQTGRGQFTGLATRQERNPRNGSGDGSQETPHGGIGHLVHRFLLGRDQSWKHHVGFQDHSLQRHPLCVKLVENPSSPGLTESRGVAPPRGYVRLWYTDSSGMTHVCSAWGEVRRRSFGGGQYISD